MTEREKQRMLAKAEKLSPKPVLRGDRWRCQVMVNGKRKSVTGDTPEEAHSLALALRNGYAKKPENNPSFTVREMVGRFLADHKPVLSPSTADSYRRYKRVMFQSIMDMPAATLTNAELQQAISKEAQQVSPKTVKNRWGLLSAAYREYFPEKAFRIKLPESRDRPLAIPTMDEIDKLHLACKGTEFELPFLLAVWMGLRSSEILGLTTDCIAGDIMHIKQAVVRAEGGEAQKAPKSAAGDRYIRIPPYILSLLNECIPENGRIVRHSGPTLLKWMKKYCNLAGIPPYRFHDLRHIQASILLNAGVPDKYSMERMGHSTSYMLRRYQHTFAETTSAVADILDKTMEDRLKHNSAK